MRSLINIYNLSANKTETLKFTFFQMSHNVRMIRTFLCKCRLLHCKFQRHKHADDHLLFSCIDFHGRPFVTLQIIYIAPLEVLL